MNKNKIRVIVKLPGSAYGKMVDIENTGESFHNIVGGFFEFHKIAENISLVINDTGKLDNLPLNFPLMYKGIPYDMVVGPVIVVQTSGPECVNLEKPFSWWKSFLDETWNDYFSYVRRSAE